MEWTGWATGAVRRHGGAAGRAVRRAWTEPGRERDLTVQACKAALAACVAWAVAGWWLQAPMAFVAPWVAVVLVESTVYRSLAHGLQQVAAIAVGTVVATVVALVLDSTMITMALVLPAVLLLAQWQRLGSQGIYAATGALFVLTDVQVTLATSGARIAEAVFGAVVGITVNALIRPPVYLRDTRAALADAAREAREILEAVAEGLDDGDWGSHTAGDWHERALRLGRLVDQARSAIGWSRESMRGNHRGRGTTAVCPPGKAYDDALAVLDHVAVHTAGVTRTVLETTSHSGDVARPGPRITGPYADFLRHTARAIGLYGQTRFAGTGTERSADGSLREAVGELRRSLDTLRQRLPSTVRDDPDALATHGALLAQARRLADQLVPD
ncbi:aromatic acid exporter family protein [Streptomyces sp. NPDC001536]|uniref:aromatic acid exporter family protein n=1 Tax=Streptomyces sp. NPDC001536 TaxID=3364583 RepID=UPI0036772F11